MKKQGGFTLIELVVVIVVLGILSAFALPQFVDLSGRATNSVVKGGFASAKSANALVHSAYLVEPNPSVSTISTRYGDVDIAFGFPVVDSATANGILFAASISEPDYRIAANTAGTEVAVTASSATDGADCFVYTAATSHNDTSTLAMGSWDDAGVAGTFEEGECTL